MVKKLILVLAIIAWGSVYLTHKIAGPLYRFQTSLKNMTRGDFRSRISLRRSDEALFLAKDFNEAIEMLDITFSKMKNIIRANDSDLPRMKTRLEEELAKIKTSVDK